MAKQKRTAKQPEVKKAPFVMAEPNDDASAFGWTLGNLRNPMPVDEHGDIWPGRPVFQIEEEPELREAYGFNIDFVNTKFVQVMLDGNKAVANATKKAAQAGYTPEARAALKRVIMREFKDNIVPAMIERFNRVADYVADFYAARLAHIQTFGQDDY